MLAELQPVFDKSVSVTMSICRPKRLIGQGTEQGVERLSDWSRRANRRSMNRSRASILGSKMSLDCKSGRLDQLQTASPSGALSETSRQLSDPGQAGSLLEVLS
jgi:hypothetical protein